MSISPAYVEGERICLNFYSLCFWGVAAHDNQFETKENYLNKGEKLSHNRTVVKLNAGSTNTCVIRQIDRQNDSIFITT